MCYSFNGKIYRVVVLSRDEVAILFDVGCWMFPDKSGFDVHFFLYSLFVIILVEWGLTPRVYQPPTKKVWTVTYLFLCVLTPLCQTKHRKRHLSFLPTQESIFFAMPPGGSHRAFEVDGWVPPFCIAESCRMGFRVCGYSGWHSSPVGTNDNSPAIYRWETYSTLHFSPIGTIENGQPFTGIFPHQTPKGS